MITYQDWLTGLVGTCQLIASDDSFYRSWVLHDFSVTSIHHYDEPFEQLIGDLHLEENLEQFRNLLQEQGALTGVSNLLAAIRKLDGQIEKRPDLQDPAVLLKSEEWAEFRGAARRLLAIPAIGENFKHA